MATKTTTQTTVVTRPRSDVTAIEQAILYIIHLMVVTRPRSDVTAIREYIGVLIRLRL